MQCITSSERPLGRLHFLKQAGSVAWRLSKLRQLIAVTALMCAAAGVANADTLIVSNTPGAGEYGSIKDANNAANDGDTILLKDGTYTSNNNLNIQVTKNVTIASMNGAANTIIDLQSSNQGSMLFFVTGSATIQGLTIENGVSLGNFGTVVVQGGAAVITQCVFKNNTGSPHVGEGGAAIFLSPSSSGNITQCQFLNNLSPGGIGGAIDDAGGDMTVSQCLFAGNTVRNDDSRGGAIALHNGIFSTNPINIVNCAFVNNTAELSGAAIWAQNGNQTVDIENCSFGGNSISANTAGSQASVIDSFGVPFIINNSIVYDNNTPAQIGEYGASFPGTSFTVQNSDVQEGYTGTGNIDIDPLFASSTSNLGLTASSPIINAGTVNADSPTVDLLGAPRDSQLDMGAYEFSVTGASPAIRPATRGVSLTAPVATFTDSSGEASPTADYSASITWGDGSSGAGTITQPGGVGTPYQVSGPHTYSSIGSKSITVTISAGNPTGLTITSVVSNSVMVNLPASRLAVSIPSSITAGVPFNVTVTALDTNNGTVIGYTGTVHFTADSPTAVLPADTTLTNGTGTFSATLTSATTVTIRARDTVVSTVTGTGVINVLAAALNHLTITAPATATAGTSFYTVVSAKDQYENIVKTYTGTIHLSTSAAQFVLPADFVLTGGAKQISVKLNSPGTQTVTATDTANPSLTATTGNIAVGTTPAKLVITGPAASVAGSANTYTVTAVDTVGNIATGYTGTVHITTTDAQATTPLDVMLVNGVGTFQVTLITAATQTVTAASTSSPVFKGTAVTVVSAASPSTFAIVAPASVTSGTAFYATVTAKDAYGNLAKTYMGTVHFTSTDLAAVLPANTTLVNGTKQVSIKLKTKPSQTVTATDTVTGITATSGAIAVN